MYLNLLVIKKYTTKIAAGCILVLFLFFMHEDGSIWQIELIGV